LLNGATPASVAAARGVAISTVRTQIRGLFVKTGTNRLPALIRVLGNVAPVLIDS
jgi:DNA-binding CsgD family transcriptional regulator